MGLSYALHLGWLLLFALAIVLLALYALGSALCNGVGASGFSESACLNFTLLQPLLPDERDPAVLSAAPEPLVVCGSDLAQFCTLTDTALTWSAPPLLMAELMMMMELTMKMVVMMVAMMWMLKVRDRRGGSGRRPLEPRPLPHRPLRQLRPHQGHPCPPHPGPIHPSLSDTGREQVHGAARDLAVRGERDGGPPRLRGRQIPGQRTATAQILIQPAYLLNCRPRGYEAAVLVLYLPNVKAPPPIRIHVPALSLCRERQLGLPVRLEVGSNRLYNLGQRLENWASPDSRSFRLNWTKSLMWCEPFSSGVYSLIFPVPPFPVSFRFERYEGSTIIFCLYATNTLCNKRYSQRFRLATSNTRGPLTISKTPCNHQRNLTS